MSTALHNPRTTKSPGTIPAPGETLGVPGTSGIPGPTPCGPAANPLLPAQRLDELAQIIARYNEVTQNLERSHEVLRAEVLRLQAQLATTDAQLQRSRRLAALGEMAAGIAHEVRNPLGAIQLYAGLIADDLAGTPRPVSVAAAGDTARKIIAAVRGLDAIVTDVLTFARDLAPRLQGVPIAQVFDRAVESHRPAIMAASVRVDRGDHRRAESQTLRVYADPELLHQAMLNIIRNAVEAMACPEAPGAAHAGGFAPPAPAPAPPPPPDTGHGSARRGGRRAFGAARLTGATTGAPALPALGAAAPPALLTLDAWREGEVVVLAVRDSGPGIARENIDRIFNPFFTTRNTGTGLGLAIVHRIVDAHGGSIAVHNDHGAVFEVRLPAAQPCPASPVPPEAPSGQGSVPHEVAEQVAV